VTNSRDDSYVNMDQSGKNFYLRGQIESTLYCAEVNDFVGLQQRAKSDVSYFVARTEILTASDSLEGEAQLTAWQLMNNFWAFIVIFYCQKSGSNH